MNFFKVLVGKSCLKILMFLELFQFFKDQFPIEYNRTVKLIKVLISASKRFTNKLRYEYEETISNLLSDQSARDPLFFPCSKDLVEFQKNFYGKSTKPILIDFSSKMALFHQHFTNHLPASPSMINESERVNCFALNNARASIKAVLRNYVGKKNHIRAITTELKQQNSFQLLQLLLFVLPELRLL